MDSLDSRRVVGEVVLRVVERREQDPRTIERALFDTIYEERRRVDGIRDKESRRRQGAYWDRVHADATRSDVDGQRALLLEVVRHFTDEVAGHFDPRWYAVATTVLTPSLDVLLNALSPLRLIRSLPGGGGHLDDQVVIEGETESLVRLARRGTTIIVPTHLSNLDSILMGYAIQRLGLPPYVYGAGLNLFANPLIGMFMAHLGAYRVDRLKKAEIYKDVLKTYAGCTMEAGYHNLFFPGGTRSRSGGVERHLKLGLLGMGLDAYIHNLGARKRDPDIFVVPCTINYELVLEAETLIDDHLKEVGRSRYIIEDDEFSRPRQVLQFVQRLFSLESRVNVRFCRPLDVFGNPVDDEGRSLDSRGRFIDRSLYVDKGNGPGADPQRDEEYTRELARAITDSYRRDTVLKATHVVSRAVFDLLRDRNPAMDLYRLLRTGGEEPSIPLPEVYERLDRVLGAVRRAAAEGRVRLDGAAAGGDAVAVSSEAQAHLSSYHRRPALERHGDRLVAADRNLLLYYGNRVDGEVLR